MTPTIISIKTITKLSEHIIKSLGIIDYKHVC